MRVSREGGGSGAGHGRARDVMAAGDGFCFQWKTYSGARPCVRLAAYNGPA